MIGLTGFKIAKCHGDHGELHRRRLPDFRSRVAVANKVGFDVTVSALDAPALLI
mgnify:CR=1 FL=1